MDLQEKKYISIVKNPKDKTKPYILCLAQRAGHILKKDQDVDKNFLNWLYKERYKGERFIKRNLFLVDAYLYFLKNKEKNTEINFFTQQDLYGYDYFPGPLPGAYIDEEAGKEHTRYFLDYFDAGDTARYMRFKLRTYFKYYEENNWQENTDNAPFPTLLFIFENETKKKHINHYAKSLLEKSLSTDIQIFLATKAAIKFAKEDADVWQPVEADE